MSCIRSVSDALRQSVQFVVCSERVLDLLNSVACEVPQPSSDSPDRTELIPQPKSSAGRGAGAGADWPLPGFGGCWNQSQLTDGRPSAWGPPQLYSSASLS